MPYSTKKSQLSGVITLEPKIFSDDRGFLFESFNQRDFFSAVGINTAFVQDNHCHSKKNVLRGLHYQLRHTQGKLVRVICGEIYDVAVNIQRGHAEFGHWVASVLSAKNKKQLWIPPGFAHGFLVLSDSADILYKTTDYYSPDSERCIAWDDPQLNINWPTSSEKIQTDRDAAAPYLCDAEIFEEPLS